MSEPMQEQSFGGRTLEEMLRELKAELEEIKAMVKDMHDQICGAPGRGLGH